jgi:hypothetical protein
VLLNGHQAVAIQVLVHIAVTGQSVVQADQDKADQALLE